MHSAMESSVKLEANTVKHYFGENDIAIIGMSGLFPQADNIQEFWQNIRHGVDSITEFPSSRQEDVDDILEHIDYSRKTKYVAGGYLKEVDKFDYEFFSLSPKEASLLDPHQRIFLEKAIEAIEDAGYGGKKLAGSKTGVYFGYCYSKQVYQEMIESIAPSMMDIAFAGNTVSMLPSRLSYFLDLQGPTMIVDTACSSSLVAIHLACQGLLKADCDLALAGGIYLKLLPLEQEAKLGIESPDAKTRTFDDSSEGTGGGEGVGIVLLKPVEKALKDRDNIYAIIKGSAINHDGRTVGITAPNAKAQESVIVEAWKKAGIDPSTISYIEAHGTGTKIGDPTEILGLKRAFARYTGKKQFCAIGSVKSNIGHLTGAAGIAGIIKAVLMLKRKELPPTLHFAQPNRNIGFHKSPVYINDILRKWQTGNEPRRCGVSSFGISGTNCHMVLEEAPTLKPKKAKGNTRNVFVLSAINKQALIRLIDKHKCFFHEENGVDLDDICYTANTGRSHLSCRLAIIVSDIDDLCNKLDYLCREGIKTVVDKDIYYEECKVSVNERSVDGLESKLNRLLLTSQSCLTDLRSLCQLYAQGEKIDWDLIYQDLGGRKVSLPTYPFERKRCWFELPEQGVLKAGYPKNHLYHHMKWELQAKEQYVIDGRPVRGLLIFKDNGEISEGLANYLQTSGFPVIEVELGEKYIRNGNNKFTIGTSCEDYERLMHDADSLGVSHIVHMFSLANSKEVTSFDELKSGLVNTVYSLLNLCKAVSKLSFKHELDLVLLGESINEISGSEKVLYPHNAVLFGIGKVIGWEFPNIRCKCLDFERGTSFEDIAREILVPYREYLVAYRQGHRYVEVLDRLELPDIDSGLPIKNNGLYIIVGGLGGVGLELARYLAKEKQVNIIMINRSKFPDRNEWAKILKENSELAEKVIKLQEIEDKGGKVLLYNTDISNIGEMSRIFLEIKEKYGTINGLIHCATVRGGGLLKDETQESITARLLPKFFGTWVIEELTKDEEMDFLILCSSAMTIIGEVGAGGYCAANAYLDAVAPYFRRKGRKAITINWPEWKNTGMSKDVKTDETKELFNILTPRKAINAFENILNSGATRVIAGQLNYGSIIYELEAVLPFQVSKGVQELIDNEKKIKASRTKKADNYTVLLQGKNNYTKMEKEVARITGEALGLKEINVSDNFYELGMDSIFAMRIINQLFISTRIKVNIADFFAHLTVCDLAQYIEEKTVLQDSNRNMSKDIEKVGGREYYPVSSAQKRMYIISKIENNTAYNLSEAIIITGTIDTRKVEEALNGLIKRHEILRTSYDMVDGEIVQKIENQVDLKITYLILENADVVADCGEKFDELVKPFDLSKAPLLRVMLVKIKQDQHVLMFDMHHIISDGRSRDILIKEFILLYKGDELPELKLQYKDYAVWQNNLLQSGEMGKQKEFWLEVFKDKIPLLNMPCDYPRRDVLDFKGDAVSFDIGEELTLSLRALGRETDTTIFMVLLSIYYIFLSRHSGQEDIVVGTVIEGRFNPDLDLLIGLFVNLLALRCFPAGSKTFDSFLAELRNICLAAYENQEYQFEELVEQLNIPRSLNRSPLFDTMFVLQNNSSKFVSTGDLMCTPLERKSIAARFDLNLDIVEVDNIIKCTMYYNTDLFKKETVERFAVDYLEIAEAVTTNRNRTLLDLYVTADDTGGTGKNEQHISFDFNL